MLLLLALPACVREPSQVLCAASWHFPIQAFPSCPSLPKPPNPLRAVCAVHALRCAGCMRWTSAAGTTSGSGCRRGLSRCRGSSSPGSTRSSAPPRWVVGTGAGGKCVLGLGRMARLWSTLCHWRALGWALGWVGGGGLQLGRAAAQPPAPLLPTGFLAASDKVKSCERTSPALLTVSRPPAGLAGRGFAGGGGP